MEPTQRPPAGQVSRLEQVRRRRRRSRVRRIVLLALLAVVLLIWLIGTFGTGFALTRDLMESARIGLSGGGGFPVRTGIDEVLRAEPLAGGFVELGKNDLVVYSAAGRQVNSIQHGYSRPALTMGDRRFCLYNRAGTEARVESRTQTLHTFSFEQPILLCSMAPGGSLAVVTRSERHTAELTLYDPAMKPGYTWKLSNNEGTPVQTEFGPRRGSIAVGCMRVEDGRAGTAIYWLDTKRAEVQAESLFAPDSLLLQMHWLSGRTLLAIYDTHAAVYSAKDGTELFRFDYADRTLLAADVSGKNTALLLADSLGGMDPQLVMLDHELNVLGETPVQPGAYDVVCTRTAAYSVAEDLVQCLTLTGEEKWRQPMTEKPQALLSTKKLLIFTGQEARELEPPRRG